MHKEQNNNIKKKKQVIEKVYRGEVERAKLGTFVKVYREVPPPVKRAMVKKKSRITPTIVEKLRELPVEKQPEAIKHIESLDLRRRKLYRI